MAFNAALKGNWNDQKEILKRKYPTLTDKDLSFEIGGKNVMLTNLQIKLGKTQEELLKIIETP